MKDHLGSDGSAFDRSGAHDLKAAFSLILGRSAALETALETAERASTPGGAPVLIVGEAGTGKELFARAMHRASRVRAASDPEVDDEDAPFLMVNCSTLPAWLLESELFGRELPGSAARPRAGLLELAGPGTVLLDEVDALPLGLQPRLLRALDGRRVRRAGGSDEMEVRCRVIASIKEVPDDGAARARILDELFDRLSALRVRIPPLREREGDVPILARQFLEELAEHRGLPSASLSPEALAVLEEHSWPGNVRELRVVLAEALGRCDDDVIRPEHLSLGARTRLRAGDGLDATGFIPIPGRGRTLASVEAEAVRLTLELTDWNQSAAARILEISRPTLARKIRRYELKPSNGAGTSG